MTISPRNFTNKRRFDCKIARTHNVSGKSNTETYYKPMLLNFKDRKFFGELCKNTKSFSKEKYKADLRFPKSKFSTTENSGAMLINPQEKL